MEGPFGEYTGFYAGERRPRPVIHVDCITYRDNPIFRGGVDGSTPGVKGESTFWLMVAKGASIWKALENAGVPNILGVWGDSVALYTNLRVQIDKISRGHAKQVAATFWGISELNMHSGKNVIVVDKDIDVFDDQAVAWALAYRTNAEMGAFHFFPGTNGSSLDPSIPLSQRDVMKYGAGKWNRVLIDATVNWDLEPQKQYDGKREPPLCTTITPETLRLVNRRWQEYGF